MKKPKENQQITSISGMPQYLLTKIDHSAKVNRRSRSAEIIVLLERHFLVYKAGTRSS